MTVTGQASITDAVNEAGIQKILSKDMKPPGYRRKCAKPTCGTAGLRDASGRRPRQTKLLYRLFVAFVRD